VEKAPDAFRTISEVAEEINVPQHVLRFWESRFTQIRPLKRGGGRRYYRPDDVNLLRGVRHLLYGEGYTIRGVQRILREEGLTFVQEVWRSGAERPPPPQQADSEIDAAIDDQDLEVSSQAVEASAKAEPSFFTLAPSREASGNAAVDAARREPTLAPPPAAPKIARLSIDDRAKLQSALDELIACRALIDAALTSAADNAADG
jgi:DNA-binding transcriptional MerR regulator